MWSFEVSQKIYTSLFKRNQAWEINREELLAYPKQSFGYHLGLFLQEHNFELIPKVESHDAYHTLTNYSVKVEDEIALQYLSFGNGKRSPYMYGAIVLGTLLLPDYIDYYIKSYHIGKQANAFHNMDFKSLLHISIEDLRLFVFNTNLFTLYQKQLFQNKIS